MRYVILRDDDTNAFTPVACLERLYRPFLERGLPVNLATIPNVSTLTVLPDGRPEGFLAYTNGTTLRNRTMAENLELTRYLLANPGFKIVQHGYDHRYLEFDSINREEISRHLALGTQLLMDAGFSKPQTFVAPYDRFTRVSLQETAEQFEVISSGWFELKRLPRTWWPRYALKKISQQPHWQVNGTRLLSHPGCLLSFHRPYDTMLTEIVRAVARQPLTVLVTHWWEYFREQQPDEPFIRVLHQTAEYLASQPDIKVIGFDDLVSGKFE